MCVYTGCLGTSRDQEPGPLPLIDPGSWVLKFSASYKCQKVAKYAKRSKSGFPTAFSADTRTNDRLAR